MIHMGESSNWTRTGQQGQRAGHMFESCFEGRIDRIQQVTG